MAGFGHSPAARRGNEVHFGSSFVAAGPLLAPSQEWTGIAGTGFSTTPSDPARTTAKPAARLLVPPGQQFNDKINVGIAAAANNGGTLIGGIDRVRFRFEGEVVDVVEETGFTFRDANGREVTYFGYWATLARPSGVTGEAHLYVEVICADATMQNRVLGPYSFYPAEELHDAKYTIDPDIAASTTNLHSFREALDRARLDGAENPLITFKKPMSNVAMNDGLPPFSYNPTGYITVKADAPVSFGRAGLSNAASVDTDSQQRPRVTGLWLKGANITLDFAYVDTLFAETGKDFVLDGITMTNSRGPNALHRGGPYFTEGRVRNSPYFLEVSASNLESVCIGASLVRGGVFSNCSRDIFSDVRCLVGTTVARQNDAAFNDDEPAFTVQYTGAESTATVARSGSADPNAATYTFRWGANSATFQVGKLASYYAGTAGDGYLFSDLVEFINTTLNAADSGWSATLQDSQGRRASSGSLAGLKAVGFGDTDCKGAALSVVSSFDVHGDWYQQRFGTIFENVIAYDNVGYDMEVQNIFLSSNNDCLDFIFYNNALGNSPVASDYFVDSQLFSQLGRSSNATSFSHVVIAHCSMPNQRIQFRNDGTATTFDSYCLVANNATPNVVKAVSGAIGAVVVNNHIDSGRTPLAEATGTTIGGEQNTKFAAFNSGDFAPTGSLLANPKAPVARRTAAGIERSASATAGAF